MTFFKKVYENKYGFDLKKYHKSVSLKKINVRDLNVLNTRELIFKDDSGENFKFITHENLIFISNGINTYPCSSIVYSRTGINWIPVIVVPNGSKIYCETDISKSVVISTREEIFELNRFVQSDNDIYLKFLEDYHLTFSQNRWYNEEELRLLIKFNQKFNIHFKYGLFKEKRLLNPLQLVFSSFYYKEPMDFNLFFESVIDSKKIKRGIDYFHTNRHSLKFSNSTLEIIDLNEFKQYFENFSDDDLNDFINSYLITERLDLTKIRDEHLEIVLNSHSKSIHDFNYNTEIYKNYLEDSLNEIGLTRKIIDLFYKELKVNFLKLENLIRVDHGYDEVGSLYKEKYIFLKLKSECPGLKIISQYSPDWLGRQRIDIYIEDVRLAIEYNGKQHYEPIVFFGGEKGLEINQKRDKIKRKRCIENNVQLIEIRYNEDINDSINFIKNQINDKLKSI